MAQRTSGTIARVFWVVWLGLVCQLSGNPVGEPLCPNLIASLMTVPGNLDALVAAQRVEVRQCPVDLKTRLGSFQLAAWQQGAATPALVLQTEDSGFYQMVMIEGVYVFELMGGRATRVIAVVFNAKGIPALAIDESSRHPVRVQSQASHVVVELQDLKNQARRFAFEKSGQTRRN